jgi:hypothetical protein
MPTVSSPRFLEKGMSITATHDSVQQNANTVFLTIRRVWRMQHSWEQDEAADQGHRQNHHLHFDKATADECIFFSKRQGARVPLMTVHALPKTKATGEMQPEP